MKSTSSSLLSFVAVLLAAGVLAGAAPGHARAADSLKVKAYKDTATRITRDFPEGGMDVQIRETYKVTGSMILRNVKLKQAVSDATRVRLVQVYSYEPHLDADGTLAPVDFSLEECGLKEAHGVYTAALQDSVLFRGAREDILRCRLDFSKADDDVAIGFVLSGQHLAYAVSDAGGSIVQEAHFGRYAIATMLCGEAGQSALGQAMFTLEVRPAGRVKHAAKKRIHLATELSKTDSSAVCKIVGVPWSEK
jgi:hypothetical protein